MHALWDQEIVGLGGGNGDVVGDVPVSLVVSNGSWIGNISSPMFIDEWHNIQVD